MCLWLMWVQWLHPLRTAHVLLSDVPDNTAGVRGISFLPSTLVIFITLCLLPACQFKLQPGMLLSESWLKYWHPALLNKDVSIRGISLCNGGRVKAFFLALKNNRRYHVNVSLPCSSKPPHRWAVFSNVLQILSTVKLALFETHPPPPPPFFTSHHPRPNHMFI